MWFYPSCVHLLKTEISCFFQGIFVRQPRLNLKLILSNFFSTPCQHKPYKLNAVEFNEKCPFDSQTKMQTARRIYANLKPVLYWMSSLKIANTWAYFKINNLIISIFCSSSQTTPVLPNETNWLTCSTKLSQSAGRNHYLYWLLYFKGPLWL